ncbi:helix-turn-helix domain-containing protein [Paenibacillus sp. LMG 31461]|uniref:Helix-turn-helix domain-containing protein n=1 Tax=Paenibacillus plantarum TaxID=2654975 RepID=A0ABX1XDQ3_9BACL|nr:AraC family transcriptional regulator [Paenibacillus plantarum]NOU66035.1 helix-turn-helix domain-containing protein [Paenibacillus plantarum]
MSFPVYGFREFLPEEDFPFKIAVRSQDNFNPVLHAHEHLQLCYVTYGTCIHRLGSMEAVVLQGNFFSVPPFLEHQILPMNLTPFEIIQIDFIPYFIHENMRDLSSFSSFMDFAYIQPLIEKNGILMPKMSFSIVDKLEAETRIASMRKELINKEEGYRLAIKADLLKLLVLAGRAFQYNRRSANDRKSFSKYRQSFYQTISHMEKHFAESICLEEMAELAHMSPTYFSSVFKLVKGMGFSDFLNYLRILNATQLLAETEKSITEIVFESGYNNVAHFNKTFKKLVGITPTEYRKGSL